MASKMSTGDAIVAHMIGDYAAQNDVMAQNKTKEGWRGRLACAAHALTYTGAFAVMAALKGRPLRLRTLAVIGGTHYLIDRNRVAARMMEHTGQRGFRDGMGPWSTIIVDNTYHLAINTAALELLED